MPPFDRLLFGSNREDGVARWHVSLTHTATMAEAVVIAVGG